MNFCQKSSLTCKKKISHKALFLVCLMPLWLNATSLSLDEALKLSLYHHPSIQSKKSDYESAQSYTEAAKWQRWPSLSAEATSLQKKQPGYDNTQGFTMALQQPLFTGWKITAAIEGAKSRENVAKSSIGEAEKELQIRVLDAYASCSRLAQKIEFAKQNYNDHEHLLSSVDYRFSGGISTETDVALANARMRQAKSDLSQLVLAHKNALTTLSLLVGVEVTGVVGFGSTSLSYQNLKEALAHAYSNSPTLFRLKDEIGVAVAEKKSAQSVLYPQVSLKFESYAGLTREINDESSRIFLSANYQLGSGFSASSNIDAAHKKVLATHQNYDGGMLDIEEQITTQYNQAVSYLSQLTDAQVFAEENENVAQSYERQYVIGKKSWLDLLNVKRESTQSKYNYIDVKVNAAHAIRKLYILTGKGI